MNRSSIEARCRHRTIMELDTSKWSGEGGFTALLIERLRDLESIAFLRVEDAPATRSDADFNFISNELFVAFTTHVRRERILRFLHAGSPVDADPDALVEAADVPLVQGPLLLSRLESEGIDATGIESFDVVTNTRSRMRIMVRHADLAAARDIVERP